MKKLKIAFIDTQDVNNRNLWSGTTYHIVQNLGKKFNDLILFQPRPGRLTLLKFLITVIDYFLKRIRRKACFNLYNSYFLPKSLAGSVDRFVDRNHIDLIISATNTPFIYAKNTAPLVIITDATVKLLYDEYSRGKGWTKLFQKDLEKSSLQVAQKAALIISSSNTTTQSLINDYNLPESKIATIPFGANIDDEDIKTLKRSIDINKPVNFLFVGKDWDRKGGSAAVSVCDELLKQNIAVNLNIVGCSVPEKFNRGYITNYIYLDKSKKEDFIRLRELYEQSHFFMVFSKAEMYGIVFCEAAAYGLPVVAYSVGGIPDIVLNDKTGFIFPADSDSKDISTKILTLISNNERYVQMTFAARERYATLLNWRSFTESLESKIHEILEPCLSSE